MKWSHLIATTILFALLFFTGYISRLPAGYSGMSPGGWLVFFFFVLLAGFGLLLADSRRRISRVMGEMQAAETPVIENVSAPTATLPTFLSPEGLFYPHPVINVATCIGCRACVDACPHDVLAIVNGKAALVAVEQCMEDTSCQVECPTVPKSCIVVNTTKKILERPAPKRDGRFMTNVPGIYLIGDASGVPLIKNAINEGGAVIDYIIANLRQETAQRSGNGGNDHYDVAIIGVGPAGLSAAAMAHQRGLKYVAIEQDQIAGTIHQTYQAGKYVYFNPVEQQVNGGIKLEGAGAVKEWMLGSWMDTVNSNGLAINEYESCKDVKPDGDAFVIETEQEKTRERMVYRARRVILAIGNRGAPMKLNVAGEDLKITVSPKAPVLPYFCNECGAKRDGDHAICQKCGANYIPRLVRPYEDKRVKYKLTDPNRYSRRHILVVGAGNSAIETAIDLAAYRSEDGKTIAGWRDNAVSLAIRGNFRSDLKLRNKMLIHECIDRGRVKAYFGQTIKEIVPGGVALMSAREREPKTARPTARIRNDYVFALIGGEKPTKFLESIGIKIG
ncbi:MAG TPA: NAD(P)-binding domain-containing protein [Blastocatellia bacterium]|nr:NAD(P)-binding domain-containing protein [Blastocatellia bacterium]